MRGGWGPSGAFRHVRVPRGRSGRLARSPRFGRRRCHPASRTVLGVHAASAGRPAPGPPGLGPFGVFRQFRVPCGRSGRLARSPRFGRRRCHPASRTVLGVHAASAGRPAPGPPGLGPFGRFPPIPRPSRPLGPLGAEPSIRPEDVRCSSTDRAGVTRGFRRSVKAGVASRGYALTPRCGRVDFPIWRSWSPPMLKVSPPQASPWDKFGACPGTDPWANGPPPSRASASSTPATSTSTSRRPFEPLRPHPYCPGPDPFVGKGAEIGRRSFTNRTL